MNETIEQKAEDIVKQMERQTRTEEIETIASLLADNARLRRELAEAQAAATMWRASADVERRSSRTVSRLAENLLTKLEKCQLYGPADSCREAANLLHNAVCEYNKLGRDAE